MPECVEVKICAESLNNYLRDCTLSEINVRKINTDISDKLPAKITRVFSRGKNIIIKLFREKDQEKSYLTNHMMLSGYWSTQDNSGQYLCVVSSENKQSDKKKIYFHDKDDYGKFEYYPDWRAFEERCKKNIGPCIADAVLSGKDFFEEWKKALENKRRKNSKIGVFLMNQKVFSGIGNYIRAELLYMCKISPFRKLGDLSEGDISAIYENLFVLIREIYENGGRYRCFLDGSEGKPEIFSGKTDRKIGQYKCQIYGRKRDKFGNEVSADFDSQKRLAYWVPDIQT